MKISDLSALVDRRHHMLKVAAQTGLPNSEDPSLRPNDVLVTMARNDLNARQRKKKIFSESEIFGEPAFEILLHTYVADAERRTLAATELCSSASVPISIGTRYISILEQQGLLSRHPSMTDFRTTIVSITHLGIAKINEFYLSHLEHDEFP